MVLLNAQKLILKLMDKKILTTLDSKILFLCVGRSRKFCQRGPKFDNIFSLFFFKLVDEGREDPNINVNGPSSARQPNTVSLRGL